MFGAECKVRVLEKFGAITDQNPGSGRLGINHHSRKNGIPHLCSTVN